MGGALFIGHGVFLGPDGIEVVAVIAGGIGGESHVLHTDLSAVGKQLCLRRRNRSANGCGIVKGTDRRRAPTHKAVAFFGEAASIQGDLLIKGQILLCSHRAAAAVCVVDQLAGRHAGLPDSGESNRLISRIRILRDHGRSDLDRCARSKDALILRHPANKALAWRGHARRSRCKNFRVGIENSVIGGRCGSVVRVIDNGHRAGRNISCDDVQIMGPIIGRIAGRVCVHIMIDAGQIRFIQRIAGDPLFSFLGEPADKLISRGRYHIGSLRFSRDAFAVIDQEPDRRRLPSSGMAFGVLIVRADAVRVIIDMDKVLNRRDLGVQIQWRVLHKHIGRIKRLRQCLVGIPAIELVPVRRGNCRYLGCNTAVIQRELIIDIADGSLTGPIRILTLIALPVELDIVLMAIVVDIRCHARGHPSNLSSFAGRCHRTGWVTTTIFHVTNHVEARELILTKHISSS